MSIAESLLRELREREDLRRALAEELLPELLRHRRLRLAVLTALYRDIATKDEVRGIRAEVREDIERVRAEVRRDLERMRAEVREDIRRLGTKVERLEARVDSLFRCTLGLIFGMWVSVMLTLVPIQLKLLGVI